MSIDTQRPLSRRATARVRARLAVPLCAALRVLAAAALFTAVSAGAAWAQIYVVVDADGTRRFTNQPASGAEVFLETPFSADKRAPGLVPYRREIDDAALRAGIDPRLIEAVIAAESAFDPKARSNKGAQGLMQLMPDTADRFGVRDVWNPRDNILGGTAYLRWLFDAFEGDLRHVLAAYNAGEGAVERHGGVPPYRETRDYVDRVLSYYRAIGGVTDDDPAQ